MARLVLLILVLTAIGCQASMSPVGRSVEDAAPPAPTQPPGWQDQLRLPEAVDLNPDPHIVEVNLEARVAPVEIRPGVILKLWTYDGGIPGPLIRVRRGNRLVVHFTNHLDEATTVHWHGLRIAAAMDGVPEHSQAPVKPGQSFDYDFIVPDAGMFWYHPHLNSAVQLGDGLYGPILVEDPKEPQGFGDELPLVLSDLSLGLDGQLAAGDQGGTLASLFGREGDVVLVNGRQGPTLGMRAGVPQRWRILNAARSRYFQLALAGHEFIRIGGDGGLMPTPVRTDRLLLIPGERADVVVVPTASAGTELWMRWVPYDRGYGTAFRRKEDDILRVKYSADAPVLPPPLPATGRTIAPIDTSGATPIDIRFTNESTPTKFALGVNGKPFGGDDHLHARVGETQVWSVTNTIEWSHPFHLHGFFFQVLDSAGAPVQPIEWKDTADVPVNKTLKLAVRYDDRPGIWMFHCHILDHAEAGMMGMLLLE